MAAVERHHWWFRGRRALVAEAIGRLPLAAEAAIVEIGCGTGGNLAMLETFGRVTAVEGAAEARALMRERVGRDSVAGWLPEPLPLHDRAFDLAVLLDVLEHVEDDAAGLRRIARLLRPGGHLVLTLPAFPALWSAHDDAHGHHRRYRRRGVRTLLAACGFEVLRATHFNTALFPAVAALRMVARRLGAEPPGHRLAPLPRAVNALLEAVLAAERRLLRVVDLPFGVSLLVTARLADAQGSAAR
jgi:SAM-dependent methyltransferase